MGLKLTHKTIVKHSNQAELDRLQNNVRIFQNWIDRAESLRKEIVNGTQDSDMVKFDTYNLRREITDSKTKVGELYMSGRIESKVETTEVPFEIFENFHFKMGTKVKLTRDGRENLLNQRPKDSRRGKHMWVTNPVGTIIMRTINLDKYSNCANVEYYVCFGCGVTVLCQENEIQLIKPNPRKPKTSLALVEE